MKRQTAIIFLFMVCTGLYAQKQDSVRHRILKQWTLSPDYSEEVNVPIDTLFSLSNRFRIADEYSPVNAMLGNYGLPFYQINFFDRITDPDKFLFTGFYPFMYLPDKPLFMNTQVPFTELSWTFGGKRETAEQTFRVRHSQNVNRFFNVGLIYDIVFSLGQYSYQRAEDKTATFYASYTASKYKVYFATGINSIMNLENGGITDISELDNSNTRDVPVSLGGVNNAKSTLKDFNLLLVQKFTVSRSRKAASDTVAGNNEHHEGLRGTFSHILTLDRAKRSYSDSYPESGFYDSIYISNTSTFDSLSNRYLKNTIRFDFETSETRKFRLGGGFGFRNEIYRYSQIVPTHDTIAPFADTVRWNRSNNALVGRLFNAIGEKFRWVATGELFISGYRAGDFDINGEISKYFDMKKGNASWIINGGMMNRQPSFWYSQWGGNNFEWQRDIKKEFRIDIGSSLAYPARKLNLRFNYAVIKNYTDFDSTAMPAQYSGGLSVASFTLSKGMRAWKFHLDPDIIVQTSSNRNVLDLPLATVRAAAYFEHRFLFRKTNGKLNTQIGFDVTYNTLYHPYAFMPATGRFYRQYETEAGNYPFVNVFLNLKLKRTSIFVMFDHLNHGMMGDKLNKDYLMVPYYPMNITMFRFGVKWTFYN